MSGAAIYVIPSFSIGNVDSVLANRSVQEGTGRKVEFGHYYCAV